MMRLSMAMLVIIMCEVGDEGWNDGDGVVGMGQYRNCAFENLGGVHII